MHCPCNAAQASATAAPASSASAATSSMVNRSIQQLAQKYCTECKASFDELSKIVQKVLASRKELVEYEHKQKDSRAVLAPSTPILITAQPVGSDLPSPGSLTMPASNKQSSGRCYGCASAAVEHCITLLRALATSVPYRCVMQLFLMGISSQSPIVLESITLPCLKMLQNIIKPDPPITKRNKDKSIEELATVRPSGKWQPLVSRGWVAVLSIILRCPLSMKPRQLCHFLFCLLVVFSCSIYISPAPRISISSP